MTHENLLRWFPEISQLVDARNEIEYIFDDDQVVYPIKKGPATRIFEVRSGNTTYVKGQDYDEVLDPDGRIKSIDWGIGGDSPDDGAAFIIDQEFETIFYRYLRAHDEEFDQFEDDLEGVKIGRQIDNAETEDELSRIGALFGELGRQRGRGKEEYRQFLKGIVESFDGRGTVPGLKFAIAAGVGTDPSNVTVIEDFQNLEYTVQLDNVNTSLVTSAINDLADLADPSCVKLNESIIVGEGEEVIIDEQKSTVTTTEVGLGSSQLSFYDDNGDLQTNPLGGFTLTSDGDPVPQ